MNATAHLVLLKVGIQLLHLLDLKDILIIELQWTYPVLIQQRRRKTSLCQCHNPFEDCITFFCMEGFV